MAETPPVTSDQSSSPPRVMTFRFCNACHHPADAMLCSHGCDQVDEAGTYEVRYVPESKVMRLRDVLERLRPIVDVMVERQTLTGATTAREIVHGALDEETR